MISCWIIFLKKSDLGTSLLGGGVVLGGAKVVE